MEVFKHKFKSSINGTKSSCDVYVYSKNEKNYILFANTGEGTSVTNASEQIATEVINLLRFDPKDCEFFETYPEYQEEMYIDNITYNWENNKALHPTWTFENNVSDLESTKFIKLVKKLIK